MSTRLPAPRRRRQLLDVALEMFAVGGFHGTSMDDVAEAAGVTKPVLYQHFDSKRQLYLELLDYVGSRLMEAVTDATTRAASPHGQVEAGFAAYFRFVDAHENAFRLLFGGGARRDPGAMDDEGGDVEFAEAVRRVETVMAESIAPLIRADIDLEHRRVLAHAMVGMAEAVGRHWIVAARHLDPAVLARQVADLAWAGLRGVQRVLAVPGE
jgi:AcrR family transcriptional regulator